MRRKAAVRAWALLALGACFATALAAPKRSPKEEVDTLVRALLPRAVEAAEKRAFYPLGGSISADGTIWHVPAYTGRESMNSQQVLDRLLNVSLQARALEASVQATAACFDARIAPPRQAKKTDVIACYLDHRKNYSVTVYFPYEIDAKGKVALGAAFSAWSQRRVFFPAPKAKR